LRIILGKSERIPVGEVLHMGGLASILGCQVNCLPLKYLGLPLRASFKRNLYGSLFLTVCIKGWLGGRKCIFPKGVVLRL
jgi:hypothetical protein